MEGGGGGGPNKPPSNKRFTGHDVRRDCLPCSPSAPVRECACVHSDAFSNTEVFLNHVMPPPPPHIHTQTHIPLHSTLLHVTSMRERMKSLESQGDWSRHGNEG